MWELSEDPRIQNPESRRSRIIITRKSDFRIALIGNSSRTAAAVTRHTAGGGGEGSAVRSEDRRWGTRNISQVSRHAGWSNEYYYPPVIIWLYEVSHINSSTTTTAVRTYILLLLRVRVLHFFVQQCPPAAVSVGAVEVSDWCCEASSRYGGTSRCSLRLALMLS